MSFRMPRIRFSRRFLRITGGIVGFVLLLMALAAWQVPELTRRALTGQVATLLGREISVGKITFNPFTLHLLAHDIAVAQPGGAQPLVALAQADINASWKSVFWFAPVVESLVLREPKVALVREGPDRFNFSDIQQKLQRMSGDEPEQTDHDESLPRFSLNNMRLENGSITLDDKVTGRKQVIDEIGLGVPFISTFGYAADIDVLPRFQARINGSEFDLHGTARPFDVVPSSTLDVVFSDLALEQWADAWGVPLPIKLQHGLLDSNLHIVFEQPADAPPKLRITGNAAVRELDLREASDDGLLAWQALNVREVDALPLEKHVHIGTVELVAPRIQTRRYDDQRINWIDIVDKLQRLGAGASTEGPPPVSTVKTAVAPPALAGASAPGQQGVAGAEGAAATPAAPGGPGGAVAAAAPATPSEPDPWRVGVGTVALSKGQLRVRDAATGLDYTLDQLDLMVKHVQLPQPKDQPIDIQLSAKNPDGAGLKASGAVILQPLDVKLDVNAARLPVKPFAAAVRSVAPVTLLSGTAGVAAQLSVADRNGVYAVRASAINVDLADLSARDETLKPPVTVALKTLNLKVDQFVPGSTDSSKFDLHATGLLGEGVLSTQGSVTLQPLAVKAGVDLSNLNVAQLAPYAASSLNATVRSIRLGAKGDVAFAAASGGTPMTLSWKGGVDVNDLNLQDRINRADFLAWKRLSMRGMAVSLANGKPVIDLGDVTLDDFYGNVLLNAQGRLNVLDLVAEPGKAGGSITEDTQSRAEPAPASSAKRDAPGVDTSSGMPAISVRSVTLKDGRATFNDRFVRPNYTAELSGIQGSVSAVSSSSPKPAKVNVKGKVYRTAPLTISGIVQPFSKYLTLDIKASARGVDLPRFTTYSAKYVGYPIKRGKLSLDVEYRIKNRRLQASNRVQLDQLTFGAKTNSPSATTLPVMLAVALLKDRQGNIDINLPVSGSLDDPNFSVGGIILRVLGNLVVKAVTSPFSLLASAFGGSGEHLSYVEFAPGSASLSDDAKAKLQKIATAMTNRPALKMDISGRADPATDEAGLRQAWVDNRIRAARDRATGKSGRLGSAAPLSDADRAKYLEKAYDNAEIEGKPRNFIGIAKSLPPQQMEDLLRRAAPAGQAQLRRLADARAQAAYEQLEADGAPMDRIYMVEPSLTADGLKDDGAPRRVEFALKR